MDLQAKLDKTLGLIHGATTQGERRSAIAAYERLAQRQVETKGPKPRTTIHFGGTPRGPSNLPVRMGGAPRAAIGPGRRAIGSGRSSIPARSARPQGSAAAQAAPPQRTGKQTSVIPRHGQGVAAAAPPAKGMSRFTKGAMILGGAAAVGTLVNRSGRGTDRGRTSMYRY